MLHVIDAEAVSIPLTWLGVGVVTAVIYTRCPSIVNCVQSSLHHYHGSYLYGL